AKMNGWSEYVNAAGIVCTQDSKEPAIQKATAVIEQLWINVTGLSEADAVEDLKLRVDDARMKSYQKKLCDDLAISDEIDGEEKAFMQAKRALFGCRLSPDTPMWGDSGARVPDDLIT